MSTLVSIGDFSRMTHLSIKALRFYHDQGLAGVALITACLVAVVLPLVDGRQAGWPAWSWLLLAAAVPLAVAFVLHQRRKADRGGVPLLNPRVFAA